MNPYTLERLAYERRNDLLREADERHRLEAWQQAHRAERADAGQRGITLFAAGLRRLGRLVRAPWTRAGRDASGKLDTRPRQPMQTKERPI